MHEIYCSALFLLLRITVIKIQMSLLTKRVIYYYLNSNVKERPEQTHR